MVVFDLDDTLYKEADFVKSALCAIKCAITASGEASAAELEQISHGCDSTSDTLDRWAALLAERNSATEFTVSKMLQIYRFHQPDITLAPDTVLALKNLHGSGVKLGLITDGRVATQRAKIAALGLENYFAPENILISEETGADKTSDHPFKLMMERNPNQDKFIYVGDNPAKDFYWPNRLGWLTVQLDDVSNVNIHPQTVRATFNSTGKRTINSYNSTYSNAAMHIRKLSEILPIILHCDK